MAMTEKKAQPARRYRSRVGPGNTLRCTGCGHTTPRDTERSTWCPLCASGIPEWTEDDDWQRAHMLGAGGRK